MRLGEQIREARESKGLTQDQLAQAVGVDRKTVSNWEVGNTNPRGKLLALKATLGLGALSDVSVTPIDSYTIEFPPLIVDGLSPTELEELSADLVARAWSKSAEIKARPNREALEDDFAAAVALEVSRMPRSPADGFYQAPPPPRGWSVSMQHAFLDQLDAEWARRSSNAPERNTLHSSDADVSSNDMNETKADYTGAARKRGSHTAVPAEDDHSQGPPGDGA